MRPKLILALFFPLAACGGDPVATRVGPRLEAALTAAWPTTAPARQTAFSRDGRLIAAADSSGLITLRNTRDWRPTRKLEHPGGATSVAFSKDGSTLFSGGYDGQVRQWDVRTGKQTDLLTGARSTIWTIALSPDGTRLAAAGEDAMIRIWNLADPRSPLVLRGHRRNIWEVRFSPDGTRLASGSFDHDVRLWNAQTGAPIRTLLGHSEAVVGLDYSPDGKLLASGADDSTIRLWRASDGAPIRTIGNGVHVDKVAFSPDGKWLASGGHARKPAGEVWHQLSGGGQDGPAVRLWRVADGRLIANLLHPDDVIFVSFSRDGHWLVTSGEDDRFRLWRLTPERS